MALPAPGNSLDCRVRPDPRPLEPLFHSQRKRGSIKGHPTLSSGCVPSHKPSEPEEALELDLSTPGPSRTTKWRPKSARDSSDASL